MLPTPPLADRVSHRGQRTTGRSARPRAPFWYPLHARIGPRKGTSSTVDWKSMEEQPGLPPVRAAPPAWPVLPLRAKAIKSTALVRGMGDR